MPKNTPMKPKAAHFMPKTVVSSNVRVLIEAAQHLGRVVLKPLFGSGGGGILVLEKNDRNLRSALELLTNNGKKPVMLQQIKEACDGIELADIREALANLKEEYEKGQRGMLIVEIADGYQMLSNSNYVTYIRNFYKTRHKERLSKPALETLAIIAYKQPVTRSDVELIRGVNSDGVMVHLLNKELIKAVGRKDVPGRPFLY